MRRSGETVKPDAPRKNLWFENGFWWFRRDDRSLPVNITPYIRDSRFQITPLACKLGLGERTFHRLVKDSLGIPPGVWLRWERAVAARHRIREGCPVKQVAVELGFANPGDFSDEFKRWHKVSPLAYQGISRSKQG